MINLVKNSEKPIVEINVCLLSSSAVVDAHEIDPKSGMKICQSCTSLALLAFFIIITRVEYCPISSTNMAHFQYFLDDETRQVPLL